MLKRKIYNDLLSWKEKRKNEKLKKCLIVKGARQVGKSYIIKEFGRREYKSFIEIDFFENPDLKAVFDGELSSDEILKRLTSNIPGVKIIPGDTLLFLDEIQCCGNARTAVKYLADDLRVDVILSGSLLGLSYGENGDSAVEEPASIPVGYEMTLTLFSLDFEEFLWSMGYEESVKNDLAEYFESDKQIPEVIHNKFEMLFREFMVVGGMPEVVADFSVHKDFGRVDEIQRNIISDYREDISKYAKGKEKQLVRMCYDAVPKQLAKELKKFQYSTVEKGQTGRKYRGSIQWLKDSGMVNQSYNVTEPFLPLGANSNNDRFKLYLNDTGLLCCVYGFETKRALLNNTLTGNAKGGLYENIIGECLVKNGYSLFYYKPNDNCEIEFLLEKNGGVVPVEVKASNGATVSLNAYTERFSPSVVYKLTGGRNGMSGTKNTLPHYMVMFL